MDDLLGVGILGAGWITRAHGLAIRTLSFMAPVGHLIGIAMLAARDPGRGRATASTLGADRRVQVAEMAVAEPSASPA